MNDFKKVLNDLVESIKKNDSIPNPVLLFSFFKAIGELGEKELCAIYGMAVSLADDENPINPRTKFANQIKMTSFARMKELLITTKAKSTADAMREKFFTITGNNDFEV